MEGRLEEKRLRFRLFYAEVIRVLGVLCWLLHLNYLIFLNSGLYPRFISSSLSHGENTKELFNIIIEYRSKRIYYHAAEHIVILWNVIYVILIAGKHNRVWCFVWLHYNWTATPLLVSVIILVEFASQDMSYYSVLEGSEFEEVVIAVVYFMIGFNTYLLAFNQLRFLQSQVTRPFKPGIMLPTRTSSASTFRVGGMSSSLIKEAMQSHKEQQKQRITRGSVMTH